MGTNAEKRARQKANRDTAATPPPARGRAYIILGVAAVAVIVGLAVWQPWRGDDKSEAATSEKASEKDDSEPDTTATQTAPCPATDGSEQRRSTFDAPPEMCIDPSRSYSAGIDTTLGRFTITLDPKSAPETVNNFVVLARHRYYEGVPFHRVVPGFVIQAGDGDGTADGSNDLGYTIPDELPDSPDAYVDYSVAMANSGPGTNGSQFFVVLPGGGNRLTASYSVFGQVTEGTEVVDDIGALGGSDETPSKEVLINSVTINET